MDSLWQGTAHPIHFPSLSEDVTADVAVVGGGITGLTAAMLLAEAGKRVIVLEAGAIGSGSTGTSTGNLYAVVDRQLCTIEDKWGRDVMEAVAQSRVEAIDLIEHTVRRFGLDCQFQRRPFYLYASEPAHEDLETIEREYRAAKNANLNAVLAKQIPLPVPVYRALVIEGQAQFHPANYVRDLARQLAASGCRICENTRVTNIDDNAGVLQTETGTVRAEVIIMATHSPKGVYAVHALMEVYREYGIAATIADRAVADGIYWDISRKTSIRAYDADGERYLIVIGGKHLTGHDTDTRQCYRTIKQFARDHFALGDIAFEWSAQNYRSADGLPYIGRSPGSSRTFIATGFGADGLTYGSLAASIISEEILGRESRWSDLYDARRFTPIKSASRAAAENLHVAKHLLQDYFARRPKELEQVPPGEGRILKLDGTKVAVYRDEFDHYTLVSPTCTHLGCLVHWNSAERSWDCPCHGSRFTATGAVIEGPALAPLEQHGAGTSPDAPSRTTVQPRSPRAS